jgi:hypothetical protein
MHKGFTVWLTAAKLLEQRLRDRGANVEVLDGASDSSVNRSPVMCGCDSGRDLALPRRARTGCGSEFPTSLRSTWNADRDSKGLYKAALLGKIDHFTGISDPYEPPLAAEVTVHSAEETLERGLEKFGLRRFPAWRRPIRDNLG